MPQPARLACLVSNLKNADPTLVLLVETVTPDGGEGEHEAVVPRETCRDAAGEPFADDAPKPGVEVRGSVAVTLLSLGDEPKTEQRTALVELPGGARVTVRGTRVEGAE
jgi:hypothetical protein